MEENLRLLGFNEKELCTVMQYINEGKFTYREVVKSKLRYDYINNLTLEEVMDRTIFRGE